MTQYQTITLSPGKRYFVCGDVHGHFKELVAALSLVGFSDDDHLFLLGDMVNRGKENNEVIAFSQKENVTAIAGNHEFKLVDYVDGKLDSDHIIRNGGYWFTQLATDEQASIAAYFKSLPVAVKVTTPGGRTRGLVHAACYPGDWDALVESLSGENFRRTRNVISSMTDRTKFNAGDEQVVDNIDWVLVGHNPVETIGVLGNTMYLDCGVYLGGELKLLDIISLAVCK